MNRSLERQRSILDFALSSLWRRKGKNLSLLAVYTLVVFIIGVAVSKHISAGSILGAGTFPLGAWLIYQPSAVEMLAVIAACVLILYRHRANMQRIRLGTESVFHWSKK